MLVSVLASGSKGNSTFIKTNNYNFLIDAGTNESYLEEKLNENGFSLKDINYILITHTHSDHISSLKSIIKKYKPTIILTGLMLKDMSFLKDYDSLLFLDDNLIIDDIKIDNIKTSHDTSDSRGYIISDNKSSLVQITDTGYLNHKYFEKLSNKNMYIFESNHNVDMLLNGKYPAWLKRRVSSDVGHLSNESSSFYLSKLIGEKTKLIVLAHLSEENNTPDIALDTIRNEFLDKDINFSNIIAAKQNEKTELVEI